MQDLAIQSPGNGAPREQEAAEVGHGTLAGTHFGGSRHIESTKGRGSQKARSQVDVRDRQIGSVALNGPNSIAQGGGRRSPG
jgi:hypothetical protein